jgi:serine/threonine protein phosphatase 1
MRTYAIADLHGRYDLLEKALELIEADSPEGGKLVVLGDFVDRGFETSRIINRLRAGPKSDKWQWVILQGNHEDIMLQAYRNPACLNWWLRNGGDATLLSYGFKYGDKLTYPLKVDADHIAWLTHLPVFHEDEHRIFVHAGVPHDKLVTETKRETLQWMLHEGDVSGHADLYEDKPNVSGKHLVHGHHQSEHHPLLLPHRTNLDSFAWYTGKLAIGVFEDDKAEPVKTLEVTGPDYKELAHAYFS